MNLKDKLKTAGLSALFGAAGIISAMGSEQEVSYPSEPVQTTASARAMDLCYAHLNGLVEAGEMDFKTLEAGKRILDDFVKTTGKEKQASMIHEAFWDLWEHEAGKPKIIQNAGIERAHYDGTNIVLSETASLSDLIAEMAHASMAHQGVKHGVIGTLHSVFNGYFGKDQPRAYNDLNNSEGFAHNFENVCLNPMIEQAKIPHAGSFKTALTDYKEVCDTLTDCGIDKMVFSKEGSAAVIGQILSYYAREKGHDYPVLSQKAELGSPTSSLPGSDYDLVMPHIDGVNLITAPEEIKNVVLLQAVLDNYEASGVKEPVLSYLKREIPIAEKVIDSEKETRLSILKADLEDYPAFMKQRLLMFDKMTLQYLITQNQAQDSSLRETLRQSQTFEQTPSAEKQNTLAGVLKYQDTAGR